MRKKSLFKSLLSLAVAGSMCLGIISPAVAADTATTIQVTETEGTVSVTNSRGRSLTLSENMRLYNGYQVTTQESSYAWLNLDDSKLAKEDAASVVEIRKDGKKLELLVSSGNLYFNVTKPLDSDETLNIRTSSMVTGVRGTCGWVESVDSGHSQVYVLEGTLECQVTDPVSGQSKTATLRSGEVGNFYVYTQAQGGEYCGVTTEKFSEDAISGFVLMELAEDSALCGQIQAASGLNVRSVVGNAQSRLSADETAMNQRVDSANQQAANQANNISRNLVWNGENGGSVQQSASASAEQLNAQLAQADINEVTISGTPGIPETFTVDDALDVPVGKTLTLGDNVNIVVQSGAELNVAGTLHTAGNLTNHGTIEVTSGNTLRVEGQLVNDAGSTINNHGDGRIVATGGILNAGTIINSDRARIVSEGIATVRMQTGGTLRFTGGAIINEGPGYALLREGSMTPAEAKTLLSSTGSFSAKTGNVLGAVDSSGVYTTVYPEGYSAHIQSNGYYKIEQGTGGTSRPQSSGGSSTVYVNSTYALTFDPNGGTMAGGIPVRAGYRFTGWTDRLGNPFGSNTTVSSDMTLYAQWAEDSSGGGDAPAYTVAYDPNGGTLAEQGGAPVREGHTFLGWSPARDGSAPYPTAISGDLTLYAQWRENEVVSGSYTLTFNLDGGTMAGGVPVKAGYAFAGWYTGPNGTGSPLTSGTAIDADMTWYARWKASETPLPGAYTITFDLNGGETGNGGVPFRDGYVFAGWYMDEDFNQLFDGDALTIRGDTTLYADWDEARDLIVAGGVPGADYTYGDDGVLRILTSTPLIIKNRDDANTTTDRIFVNSGVDADIVLAGVSIDTSSRGEAAFEIASDSGGAVAVTLAAGCVNRLTSGDGHAGLEKSGTTSTSGSLTIGGLGELTATSGSRGAGIGGGALGVGQHIIITGGTIIATAVSYDYLGGAGIGGGAGYIGCDITIAGGTVTAIGGMHSAGIGGGHTAPGYDIRITGGKVTATGGGDGAGIGGGDKGTGSDITICGGEVIATGGNNGAGIGGGYEGKADIITISGGNVIAIGGDCGAGIGGGYHGGGYNITIGGGKVKAIGGGYGAGIGGGYGVNADGCTISVSGGNVEAVGGHYAAGIGGGRFAKGYNISISGGWVRAEGQDGGAGIGCGYQRAYDAEYITVSGGTIYATGNSYGKNIGSDSYAGVSWHSYDTEPDGVRTYRADVRGGFYYEGGSINQYPS